MAIVEMKKITLLALNQDKGRLFRQMQRLGCIEVTAQSAEEAGVLEGREKARLEEISKLIARIDLCIARLAPFDKNKKKMFDLKPVIQADQVTSVVAARGELLGVVERVEEIERTRGELRARETRDLAQIEQFRPWEQLDLPLEKVADTQFTHIELFSIPARMWAPLTMELGASGAESAVLENVSQVGDTCYGVIYVHKDHRGACAEAMKKCGATGVVFEGVEGTAMLAIDQLQGRLKRAEEIRGQLAKEIEKLADNLPLLRMLRDIEALEKDRLEAAERCLQTKSAFFMTGWAPSGRTEEIAGALKKISSTCEIEFSEPGEGEMPPTLLRNKPLIAPFETIIGMFSMPDPHGMDPTFIMVPFWVCFFGMMVSDAGYGIVLAIAASLIWYKLKGKGTLGKMSAILALGGLSTVFWGAMYGGWFSIEGIKPLLFAPMDKPLEMMILCMAIGAVQLLFGIGAAAYMNIKRGKPLDALFDQGSWMLILIGLAAMILNQTVGLAIAGIGVLIVLTTSGREKSKNPIKRILSGLGALYGISGYVSDILSYARLFGMGLATGVIGMVFNTLAGMLMGSPVGMVFAVVVLFVGHTFNLGINALGAYVHSCRLQYIEFFGKFYESGGRDFRPLTLNTRYVDIAE